MVDVIYTLSVVRDKDFTKDGQPWRSTRCWGWYHTPEDAELALTTSPDFWAECGYYNHAVVEKYEAGFSIGDLVRWYRMEYNPDTQQYLITGLDAPPEPWTRVCNFALG